MTRHSKHDLLRRAANRASSMPFFFATVLTAFSAERGMDDDALASWLGCPRDQIHRLALCRRPDCDSMTFRHDVEHVASYVGANAVRLAEMVREVDAWSGLRAGHTSDESVDAGLLMAARDREEPVGSADTENAESDSSKEPDDGA